MDKIKQAPLVLRHEWNHLMTAARRHAREQNSKTYLVAQRVAYPAPASGWHYVILRDPASAARVRSFRERSTS